MRIHGRFVGSFAVAGACFMLPISSANAAPTSLPDQARTITTDDGWIVTLSATELSANPVPNLASTPTTREGFFSAKVVAEISGTGTSGVRAGYIEQGLQVGCAVDVSSGAVLGLQLSIGPSVGVTINPFGPGANAGLNGSIAPSIQTTIKPGAISTIPLGRKDLSGPRAAITARDIHIQIDACAGPVTIRSYAMVAVTTDTADDSAYVYSDPTWL